MSATTGSPPHTPFLQLGILVLLAVVLRGGVAWQFRAQLEQDRDAYLSLSEGVAQGHGLVQPRSDRPTAYRPPLYPLLLAPLRKVLPLSVAVAVLNIAAGVITVLAVTRLVRRHLPGAGGTLSVWLAGMITVCDPLLLYNTALPMTETLAAALLAVWLGRTLPPHEPASNPFGQGLTEGLVWGLATLCRPVFLPLGAVVMLWSTLFPRLQANHTAGRRRLAGISLGAALLIAPWVARNTIAFGEPVFTTTHGGYTLLLGHNPVYYREVVNAPAGAVWSGPSLEAWQRSLEQQLGGAGIPPFDELRRDRWFNAQARAIIQDDPALAWRSGLTLLGRFWSVAPKSVTERPLPQPLVWGITVWNVGLFLLAALGLVRLLWHRVPLGTTALLTLLIFSAVHFVYWSDQRMRAPLVPLLACLAAAAPAKFPRDEMSPR